MTVSSSDRAAIVGLCRERVPLGIIARGLSIRFALVEGVARELLAAGDIAELPACDVRDGRVFSWAERLLVAEASDHASAPTVRGRGVSCPCCGQTTTAMSPDLIARAYQLPPQQEAILRRIWQAKGKAVTIEACLSVMWEDDADGGLEFETGRKYFNRQLCLLRSTIAGSGVRIETCGYQRGYRIVLDNAEADDGFRCEVAAE